MQRSAVEKRVPITPHPPPQSPHVASRPDAAPGWGFQLLVDPNEVVMVRRVGAGAYGEVFFATLGREPVAVKTVRGRAARLSHQLAAFGE